MTCLRLLPACVLLWLCLSVSPLLAQEKMNVLLICIDDLRPELASFGQEYIVSPNIDRLAQTGRPFYRHYVNAPSCGPSRYTLLTGTYGIPDNYAIFQRAALLDSLPDARPPSMPEWFRSNGYATVSIGKVSHHPGGYGGEDWNDSTIVEMPGAWDRSLMPVGSWQHPRGTMHALANGDIRPAAPGTMQVMQSVEGPDSIYPDGLITETALTQMDSLASDDKPFFLAVGLIKPHLPFGAPRRYLDLYDGVELPAIPNPDRPTGISTWHGSGEFRRYDLGGRDPLTDPEFALALRKHYAACVSYADAQVGRIMEKLRESGQEDSTIVVLWGDHGWNLGNHAIWGKHNLYEEGLRSPLIVRYPGMPRPGEPTTAIVESVDIFPTLTELAGLPAPSFAHGVSFKSVVDAPEGVGEPAIGYWGDATTIRTDRYRLVAHADGGYELYDHQFDPYELNNIAGDETQLVSELHLRLTERLLFRE